MIIVYSFLGGRISIISLQTNNYDFIPRGIPWCICVHPILAPSNKPLRNLVLALVVTFSPALARNGSRSGWSGVVLRISRCSFAMGHSLPSTCCL